MWSKLCRLLCRVVGRDTEAGGGFGSRSSPTHSPRHSPGHPKGRNEVEEPRGGLTRRVPWRSRLPWSAAGSRDLSWGTPVDVGLAGGPTARRRMRAGFSVEAEQTVGAGVRTVGNAAPRRAHGVAPLGRARGHAAASAAMVRNSSSRAALRARAASRSEVAPAKASSCLRVTPGRRNRAALSRDLNFSKGVVTFS